MLKRPLRPEERHAAREVFDAALNYDRVWVIEGATWPDHLARLGAWLSKSPPPSHNAITLGWRLFFPVALRTTAQADDADFVQDMSWLIHELTHAWQYQHAGIRYLFQALWAQITLGPRAYAYGWEEGLRQAHNEGKSLTDFNREQQGDIARHYYYRLAQGQDTSAWLPFIAQLKAA